MAIHYITLKQCSRKENCVNPLGSWLPATNEYFPSTKRNRSGLEAHCRKCKSASGSLWQKSHPENAQAACKKWRSSHSDEVREYRQTYYEEHSDKVKEKSRIYRATNPDKVRAGLREWRKKNPDHIREYNRQWRTNHPELAKAYCRNYQQTHRAAVREYQKQKYTENPAPFRAASRRYELAHPDGKRARKHQRRALEANAIGTHSSADIRLQMKSQRGLCWWCDKPVGTKYHVDHRIPLSRGGSNAPENLCITCPECNLRKRDKLPQEWNGRLL